MKYSLKIMQVWIYVALKPEICRGHRLSTLRTRRREISIKSFLWKGVTNSFQQTCVPLQEDKDVKSMVGRRRKAKVWRVWA